MGAASGFNATDALRLQRTRTRQELGIFLCVNVVGHNRQLQAITQCLAERFNKRCLA
jgi:hypothetical protein